MAENVSEKSVHKVLMQVMHPEINHNLVDLGMIKNVIVDNNKVVLTLKLPFMYVPIKEDLIRNIKEAITELNSNMQFEIKIAEMNQEERTKFMSMAREAWIR